MEQRLTFQMLQEHLKMSLQSKVKMSVRHAYERCRDIFRTLDIHLELGIAFSY